MIKIDDTPRMWVYHETELKEGKIIPAEDEDLYLSDGWVKSPNEFKSIPKRGRKAKAKDGKNVSHETKEDELEDELEAEETE